MRRQEILDDRSSGVAQTRYWNPLLKDIDHRLSLVFVRGTGGDEALVAHRWHIRRENEAGPDTYWPIVTEEGGFREMADDWLARLKARDLWNPAARRELEREDRLRRESEARAEESRREARVDEIAVNMKAMSDPGVSMAGRGWTASKRGRRGRKAA